MLAALIALGYTLSTLTVGGGAGLFEQPAVAGDAPSTVSATVRGVVVTADKQRPNDPSQTRRLIDQFSNTAAGDGRIARWAAPVCPWAAGLPEGFQDFIIGRIKANAVDAGALAGANHCAPNLLILFTPSPDALAAEMVKRKRLTLTNGGRPAAYALEGFVQSHDIVRVFRATEIVPANAGGAGAAEAVDMPAALSLSNGFFSGLAGADGGSAVQTTGARQFGGSTASRLQGSSNAALEHVVMVVDSRKAAGLTAGQLADYLSLIALADVRTSTTPFRPESIANLFVEPGGVAGLTTWDRRYLKALYAGGGALNRSAQITRMANYENRQ